MRYKQEPQAEESVEWKPSRKEAMDLSEKLKLYSPKEINGKMQYSFEQYLLKEDVISLDSFGRIQVKNPFQFKRMAETHSLMDWIDEKDMQALFQAFPEEKDIYESKKKEWMMDIRTVFKTVSAKLKAV